MAAVCTGCGGGVVRRTTPLAELCPVERGTGTLSNYIQDGYKVPSFQIFFSNIYLKWFSTVEFNVNVHNLTFEEI